MWQARVYEILARALAVMLCWVILMGLPVLFFRPPLDRSDLKLFLGVFYAILLFTGTVLERSYGTRSLLLMAFPFLVLFTALGMRNLLEGTNLVASLNFLAVYAVLFLAWRLGRALPRDL
jgi:hypothetical protein